MAVKTITITEKAYEALKSKKASSESFSETILRVAKRKPLSSFFGVLSGETGEKFEKAILEARKKRNQAHQARMKNMIEALRN